MKSGVENKEKESSKEQEVQEEHGHEVEGVNPSVYKRSGSSSGVDGDENGFKKNPYLPEDFQKNAEKSLGTGFSNVNIYQNSSKAKKLGAKAFAQGNSIHFAPKQFNPYSESGKELIAHELVHVAQQRNNIISGRSDSYEKAEIEANELASQSLEGKQGDVLGAYQFGEIQLNDFVEAPQKDGDVIWFNIDLDADLGKKEVQVQFFRKRNEDGSNANSDYYMALIDRTNYMDNSLREETPEVNAENVIHLTDFSHYKFIKSYFKHYQKIGSKPYQIDIMNYVRFKLSDIGGEGEKTTYLIEAGRFGTHQITLSKKRQNKIFDSARLKFYKDYSYTDLNTNEKIELRDFHFEVTTTLGDLFYVVFHSELDKTADGEEMTVNSFTTYYERSPGELVKHLNYPIHTTGKPIINSYNDIFFENRNDHFALSINGFSRDENAQKFSNPAEYKFYYSTTNTNRASDAEFNVSFAAEIVENGASTKDVIHPSNTFKRAQGQTIPFERGSQIKNPGESNEQVFSLLDGIENVKKYSVREELNEVDEFQFNLIMGAGLESKSIPKHLMFNYYRFREELKKISSKGKKIKIEQFKKEVFQLYNSLLDLNIPYDPNKFNYKKKLNEYFDFAKESNRNEEWYKLKAEQTGLPNELEESRANKDKVYAQRYEDKVIVLYELLSSINANNVRNKISLINNHVHDIFSDRIYDVSQKSDPSIGLYARNLKQKTVFRKGVQNYLEANDLDPISLKSISAVFVPEMPDGEVGVQSPISLYYHLDKTDPSKMVLVYFKDTGENVVSTTVKAETRAADGGALRLNPLLLSYLDEERVLGKGNLYYKGLDGENYKYKFKNEETWGDTLQKWGMFALGAGMVALGTGMVLILVGFGGPGGVAILASSAGEIFLTASLFLGAAGAAFEGVDYANKGKRNGYLSGFNFAFQLVPFGSRIVKSFQAARAIKIGADLNKIAQTQRFMTGVELGSDFGSVGLNTYFMISEGRTNYVDSTLIGIQILSTLWGAKNFNATRGADFGTNSITDPHKLTNFSKDDREKILLDKHYNPVTKTINIQRAESPHADFVMDFGGNKLDSEIIARIIQATRWFDDAQLNGIGNKMNQLLKDSPEDYQKLIFLFKKRDPALVMSAIAKQSSKKINIWELINGFKFGDEMKNIFSPKEAVNQTKEVRTPNQKTTSNTPVEPNKGKNTPEREPAETPEYNTETTIDPKLKTDEEIAQSTAKAEVTEKFTEKETGLKKDAKEKIDDLTGKKEFNEAEQTVRQQQVDSVIQQQTELQKLNKGVSGFDYLEEEIDEMLEIYTSEIVQIMSSSKTQKKLSKANKNVKRQIRAINLEIAEIRQIGKKRKKKNLNNEQILLLEKKKDLLKLRQNDLSKQLRKNQTLMWDEYKLRGDWGEELPDLFKAADQKQTLLKNKLKRYHSLMDNALIQNLETKLPKDLKRISHRLGLAKVEMEEIIKLKAELDEIVKKFKDYTKKVQKTRKQSFFGKLNQATSINKNLVDLDQRITFLGNQIKLVKQNLTGALKANNIKKAEEIQRAQNNIDAKFSKSLKSELESVKTKLSVESGIEGLKLEKEYQEFLNTINELIGSDKKTFKQIQDEFTTAQKKFSTEVQKKLEAQKELFKKRQENKAPDFKTNNASGHSKNRVPFQRDQLNQPPGISNTDFSQNARTDANPQKRNYFFSEKKDWILNHFSEYEKSLRFGKTRLGAKLMYQLIRFFQTSENVPISYQKALEKAEKVINEEKLKIKNDYQKRLLDYKDGFEKLSKNKELIVFIDEQIIEKNKEIEASNLKLKNAKENEKSIIQSEIDRLNKEIIEKNEARILFVADNVILETKLMKVITGLNEAQKQYEIFEAIHADIKPMLGNKFIKLGDLKEHKEE